VRLNVNKKTIKRRKAFPTAVKGVVSEPNGFMKRVYYLCCNECDEIVKVPYPPKEGRYKCPNCHHTIFRYWSGMVEKIYAVSLASLILLIVTNTFPFLSFEVMGNRTEINFFTSAYYLYKNQDFILAVTVLMSTIVIPLGTILNMIFIFAPLYHRHLPKRGIYLFLKIQHSFLPWSMLDVFLVGVLVSIVKLVKMGTIITGPAMWSFIILVFLLAYIQSIYDPHIIYELIDESKDMNYERN
jgi:paraquat-inducible protein A